MKEIYIKMKNKALKNGDVEMADHYERKIIAEECKREAKALGFILLVLLIVIVLVPFLG